MWTKKNATRSETLKMLGLLALFIVLVGLSYAISYGYDYYIASLHDFRPNYKDVHECIELGGGWNEEINDCEGSELYHEWKARQSKQNIY